ncbi:hypothetical protein GOP47_0004104 [Adiantum capillus-veneris]|uniref:Gnk2-homologous domain-containing protein n=1 Tax=Adiantum capillus-veneris TaxID=13818 RepID=A0A9D4ZPE7_ADICA|nr:hypothetical protein GOP47_0004104 [Adiantum capillus-veneris]
MGMEAWCLNWHCCVAVLFLLFPVLSMQQQQDSHLGEVYLQCLQNTSSSSLSSSFTRNLAAALLNFTSLSSQGASKSGMNVVGSSGPDMVYAAFQCRGDLSGQSCGECVQNATVRLPQECPQALGARVRLDGCFLRYDNQSFFELDATYVIGFCNVENTSDAATLQTIADLMDNVTNEAPKQEVDGFASASANGIFAAAQCVGYLNESECSQCLLRYPYSSMCASALGEQIYLASCDYRYETYNFLDASSPTSSLSPVPAPSLSTPARAPARARSPDLVTPPLSPLSSGAGATTSISSNTLFVLILLCVNIPSLLHR